VEEGTYFKVTSDTDGLVAQERPVLGTEAQFMLIDGEEGDVDGNPSAVEVKATGGEYIVGYGSPKNLKLSFAVEGHPGSAKDDLITEIGK